MMHIKTNGNNARKCFKNVTRTVQLDLETYTYILHVEWELKAYLTVCKGIARLVIDGNR